jgi:maltose O-acetyltransferase
MEVSVSVYSLIGRLIHIYDIKKKNRYLNRLIVRGLKMGENVEIIDTFFFDPSHCYLISIGSNCTICPNVRLIAHDASTKKMLGYTKIGRIDIKENCFLGDSVIVLPGVTIGPNSIVGAGAVVTHHIPPGSVVSGNPAKIIGTTESYLSKIKSMSKDKKIFDASYYIGRLNETSRQELLESVSDSLGFIV